MYCELLFQEASSALQAQRYMTFQRRLFALHKNARVRKRLILFFCLFAKSSDRPLEECIAVLYRDAPFEDLSLEARMFRASCKLISGYLDSLDDALLINLVRTNLLRGKLLKPVGNWNGHENVCFYIYIIHSPWSNENNNNALQIVSIFSDMASEKMKKALEAVGSHVVIKLVFFAFLHGFGIFRE